jgi:hypothetical protein
MARSPLPNGTPRWIPGSSAGDARRREALPMESPQLRFRRVPAELSAAGVLPPRRCHAPICTEEDDAPKISPPSTLLPPANAHTSTFTDQHRRQPRVSRHAPKLSTFGAVPSVPRCPQPTRTEAAGSPRPWLHSASEQETLPPPPLHAAISAPCRTLLVLCGQRQPS